MLIPKSKCHKILNDWLFGHPQQDLLQYKGSFRVHWGKKSRLARMSSCLEAPVLVWRSLSVLFLLMAEFSSCGCRTEVPVSLLAIGWRPL